MAIENGEQTTQDVGQDNPQGKENYLGDWANKDDAVKGLENLQSVIGRQGNELGDLRKQVDNISAQQAQPPPQPAIETPDLQKELQNVQEEILKLDAMDESYHRDLVSLMQMSSNISAEIQHDKTLKNATDRFQEELNRRDIASTQSNFYQDNPDFNTPEVQTQIKQRIEGDKTGMTDPLVAYREIQRDKAIEKTNLLAAENEKLKQLANVRQGTDETGTVFTGGGQNAPQQKQTVTTAERDALMMEAVMNST